MGREISDPSLITDRGARLFSRKCFHHKGVGMSEWIKGMSVRRSKPIYTDTAPTSLHMDYTVSDTQYKGEHTVNQSIVTL